MPLFKTFSPAGTIALVQNLVHSVVLPGELIVKQVSNLFNHLMERCSCSGVDSYVADTLFIQHEIAHACWDLTFFLGTCTRPLG